MVAPSPSLAASGPAAYDAVTDHPATAVTPAARPPHPHAARNAQILESSLQVSLQSGNDGLALLYRTAIEGINTVLEPELGPDAVGQALQLDTSPEATATRILSLSTAMYARYAAQHRHQSPEEVARDFVALIRGGFEVGYAEAQEILQSLGVWGAESPTTQSVTQSVERTQALVQQGLSDWLQAQLQALQMPASAPAAVLPPATTDADSAPEAQ